MTPITTEDIENELIEITSVDDLFRLLMKYPSRVRLEIDGKKTLTGKSHLACKNYPNCDRFGCGE